MKTFLKSLSVASYTRKGVSYTFTERNKGQEFTLTTTGVSIEEANKIWEDIRPKTAKERLEEVPVVKIDEYYLKTKTPKKPRDPNGSLSFDCVRIYHRGDLYILTRKNFEHTFYLNGQATMTTEDQYVLPIWEYISGLDAFHAPPEFIFGPIPDDISIVTVINQYGVHNERGYSVFPGVYATEQMSDMMFDQLNSFVLKQVETLKQKDHEEEQARKRKEG